MPESNRHRPPNTLANARKPNATDKTSQPTNGWRDGRDPIQRALRIITTIVVLGVFVVLALDPSRRTTGGDFPTLALALGAVLILLGYEGLVKLPGIGRNKDE